MVRRRELPAEIVAALVAAGGLALATRVTVGAETYPAASVSGGQVLIDRGDGKGPTSLADGWEARLSPDGQQVAFTRAPADVWVIGVDGKGEWIALSRDAYDSFLGAGSQRGVYLGDWAPDGAAIVCSYCSGFSVCDLMAVSPDGSNLRSCPTVVTPWGPGPPSSRLMATAC